MAPRRAEAAATAPQGNLASRWLWDAANENEKGVALCRFPGGFWLPSACVVGAMSNRHPAVESCSGWHWLRWGWDCWRLPSRHWLWVPSQLRPPSSRAAPADLQTLAPNVQIAPGNP